MRPSKALQLALGKPETLPGPGEVAGVDGSSKALHGQPGQDLTTLRPGMTRSQLEAVVGESGREWTTSEAGPVASPDVKALSERLLLHAESLRFAHPVTGAALAFERPAPF